MRGFWGRLQGNRIELATLGRITVRLCASRASVSLVILTCLVLPLLAGAQAVQQSSPVVTPEEHHDVSLPCRRGNQVKRQRNIVVLLARGHARGAPRCFAASLLDSPCGTAAGPAC